MATAWDKNTLEELRYIMDPDADRAVIEIYSSQSNEALRDSLAQMASNDSSSLERYFPADTTPQSLYDLINDGLNRQFSDTDIAMFQRTREIWLQHGIQYIYVLFFRALPFTYAAERPANVLRMTRLIEDQTARRIFETAQFVFDVMDEEWWKPEKRGVITAIKIRIMHAAMRYMIMKREALERWQTEDWGMPISQEDLIATNQVFSLEFFKGIKMMGHELSIEEQDAWFHTWKVIGSIMGVQDSLLMPTLEEAWDLQTSIYGHLFRDSHGSGIGLAKALVETMTGFLLSEKLVLILMYKMMKDDNFPYVFEELLGPSYAEAYPLLFEKTTANTGEIREQNINHAFFDELKKFQADVKAYRQRELDAQAEDSGSARQTIVDRQLPQFEKILGAAEHMRLEVQEHTEEVKEKLKTLLDNIFDKADRQKEHHVNGEMEKIKEDMIREAMETISKVIIDILSKYFRKGKNASFRIEANMQEHWAL